MIIATCAVRYTWHSCFKRLSRVPDPRGCAASLRVALRRPALYSLLAKSSERGSLEDSSQKIEQMAAFAVEILCRRIRVDVEC